MNNCHHHASMKDMHCASSVEDTEEDQILQQHFLRKMTIKTLVALFASLPFFISMLGLSVLPPLNSGSDQITWIVIGVVVLGVLFFSARHIYQSAWNALKSRTANMDTLIAIGTGAAVIYSFFVIVALRWLPENTRYLYFDTALMIIALVDLGVVLETRARGKTSQAIKRLIGLQPKTARVIRDGKEMDIPVSDVKVNDDIRIRPGEKIPVDGEIIEGHSNIDESMLTGEPIPIQKSIGATVVAGSMNKTGSFIFRATRVGKETALARIVDLVRRAQNTKPAIGRMVDRISAVFVPIVLCIAVITALVWYNIGPAPQLIFMLVTAITVLVIACPCALGLGTPMSVMVGVGKAAEYGVLIRNGDALQLAGQLQTILLDKTGTITEGKPRVVTVIPFHSTTETEVLTAAASIEKKSEHPLGQAIVFAAEEKKLMFSHVEQFEALSGLGVVATQQRKMILLGNEKLFQKYHISLTPDIQTIANEYASKAQTPIFIGWDQQIKGLIVIADPIKPDSKAAIDRLHELNIKVVMLTGDHQTTAAAVAQQLGIDHVYANVLPHEKLEKLEAEQANGRIVGMVGDGINDAPALAKAHVGFAIGTGTDVAIESADIALMRGSLQSVPDAIAISRATLRNIKQNLVGAFLYNVLSIPIAAGVLYPWLGILLNPVIAAGAMALSSVTIVINANRLGWFKP